MNAAELVNKLRIAEKRTFVCQMKCECGGTYYYDHEKAMTDIFSTMLNKEHMYEHKCSQCQKSKDFKNIYPLELAFEVGIDTDKDTLVKFVATEFDKRIHDDINISESEITT